MRFVDHLPVHKTYPFARVTPILDALAVIESTDFVVHHDAIYFLPASGVSMLKVTYTETGIYLEYCPEPLDLLLSDRICMYLHAQQPVAIQPMKASIPLPTTAAGVHDLARFHNLTLSACDRDWLEITVPGLWITEAPNQEEGVFVTELNPHLEQRLLHLWKRSYPPLPATATSKSSA